MLYLHRAIAFSLLLPVFGACTSTTPPASKTTETPPAATAKPESLPESVPMGDNQPKGATKETIAQNAQWLDKLPFSDRQDFDDANKGFISTLPSFDLKRADGPIWTLQGYEFLQKDQAPATINPSLFRVAKINMTNGLYQVTDKIYQIRGFDLSNMTIIEGNTGLIVIDPLISKETAKAGLDLYFQHRPKKPVSAVIYSHSHVDHYGGVKGVVSEEEVKSGKVKVLAPEGFLEEAVSENVFAGNAMSRRALYMYGALLPRDEKGQVDGGLGKTTSIGDVTLIPPTDIIKTTGEKRLIDGVEMVFQMAPGTEAPAEMLIHFPQMKALCTAEDATHTLHNLYTIRGAQVRDANKWWKALNKTLELFGDQTEVVFASHHWPKWGKDKIIPYLEKQRDMFKYIHDQALRLLNQGFTMTEIAEQIRLPQSLATEWANRGYYGTVNHNSKAVYQRYLGWYDANPANLYPWPPEEVAKRYVEFMGGEDEVLRKAKASFDKGDYRWVAEVTKHLVFANPNNQAAKNLAADALEQIGYQAEAATWRNAFLMGAYELRNGVPKIAGTSTASPDTIKAMTSEMILDFMAMKVDGPKADGKNIGINLKLPDSNEVFGLKLQNSVLVYNAGKALAQADATATVPRASLDGILMGQTTMDKEVQEGRVKVEGDPRKFGELMALLDKFDPLFNIVTP